jgi:hypothetical protein
VESKKVVERERDKLRYPSEKQSDEQTLTSPPELNPMMNPVLGRNLGRWAEVYFTTPAEQREQAVAELLRELEHGEQEHPALMEATRQSSTVAVENYAPDSTAAQISERSNATSEHIAALEETVRLFEQPGSCVAVDPLTSLSCPVCQHDNRPDQGYCGMCGYRLHSVAAPETVVEPSRHLERHAEMDAHEPETVFPSFGSQLPYAREPEYGAMVDRAPLWPLHIEEEGRGWGSIFKVIAVVVILAGAAWLFLHQRPTAAPITSTTTSPQTSPAISGPPATDPGAASPKEEASAEKTFPQATAPTDGSTALPPPATSIEEQRSGEQPENATLPAAVTQSPKAAPPVNAGRPAAARTSNSLTSSDAPVAARTKPPAAVGGGSEEFDRARDLLAGRSSAPDAGQASVWLWRAVSKHNLPAVLLLADLYARGEGVPRSCDQARVLLTAALKRGSVEATQRLQELQRSGCSER